MRHESTSPSSLQPQPAPHEPAIFAPTALLVLIAVMIGVHAYRAFVLGLFSDVDLALLDTTAYVPARFAIRLGLTDMEAVLNSIMISDAAIRPLRVLLFRLFVVDGDLFFWTLVTYAFLHGSWEHVIFNGLWLLAFGAPVMRRFGTLRFMAFFAATAAFAALFQTAFNANDVSVLVGASGAVSGLTAAAIRFAIGPMGFADGQLHKPAAPLLTALQDKRVLMFIGVWFAINLITGLGMPFGGGDSMRIAWEAHIGGFLAGLLLFRLFDPVKA